MATIRDYIELGRPFTLIAPALGFFSGAITAIGAAPHEVWSWPLLVPPITGALMAAVFAAGWFGPGWPDAVAVPLAVSGVVVAVAGAALAVWAGRSLGGSLTPYPAPSERGTLVEAGPYAAVRHPITVASSATTAGTATFPRSPEKL